jgi:hypothetical protein
MSGPIHSLPFDGALVLDVRPDGDVYVIGRAQRLSTGFIWSLADLKDLDLADVAIGDLFLVDAWLDAAFGLEPACPAPNSHISELPMRGCNQTWLADAKPPASSLQVQDGAYRALAQDSSPPSQKPPEARRALYAVGKGLEGGGCPDDETPCYQWQVLGRINLVMYQQLQAPTEPPGLAPSPTPSPPTEITCSYTGIEDGMTEVSIVDHSSSVVECDAFVELSTPADYVHVVDNSTDPNVLEVRWEIPQVCSTMAVELELWGPIAYEVPFAPGPEFVLRVNELPPLPGPQRCRPAVSTQGVRLRLTQPIPADAGILHVFRTSNGVGHDADSLADHRLEMTLKSTKAQYAAGEPIDINASILYSGPLQSISMSGLSGQPGFGFHQLDGDVQQSLASSDWTCQDLELRRDVSSTFPFRKSGVFISENFPDPDADAAYWSDPELRLPPGLYRVFASAGGVIDGFCMGGDGDQPGLSVRASIVIEVR